MESMKKAVFATIALVSAFAVAPAGLEAQGCWVARGDASDRPSPLDSAVVSMGGDMVKVCFGAPSARDRMLVGGDIHPFGAPWRTGANEATSIHLPFAATVAGVAVPAGSYSLYTVPGADSWGIHLNSVVERWGIPITDEVMANDVGSGTAPAFGNDHTETMDMTFENASADAATLVLRWEAYRVEIPVARQN